MKFKRLLTVGLMALFGAGTAMAASQLNSVQVTPKANTATIILRTTGSYAHKEYRPDQHLVLIDLTGVTAAPAIERSVALDSAVLKGYKFSSYTSASGGAVTRMELALGDGVSVEVSDKSDGLQILLSGSRANTSVAPTAVTSVASSFPSASALIPAAAPKPTQAGVPPSTSVPQPAVPIAKNVETQQAAPIVGPARPADHPAQSLAVVGASISALTPTVIRSVSVQRGHGTLDIIIEGPSAAQPFLLKSPDRLVLDFSNSVVRPSVKNIEMASPGAVIV